MVATRLHYTKIACNFLFLMSIFDKYSATPSNSDTFRPAAISSYPVEATTKISNVVHACNVCVSWF